MIEMLTGHLGSGSWKIKEQDGVSFLSHRLAFSPKSEFRIGANEILDVQVEEILKDHKRVNITLTDERSAQALIDEQELNALISMISQDTEAPEPEDHQKLWVKGLILFLIACFIYEIAK